MCRPASGCSNPHDYGDTGYGKFSESTAPLLQEGEQLRSEFAQLVFDKIDPSLLETAALVAGRLT